MSPDYSLVVYSHTEFSEILKIQIDNIRNIKVNKILFINKNENTYEDFDEVYFYDDSLPYASKLKYCLNLIDEEKILFVHDNDILLNIDMSFMDKLSDCMDKHGVNKIDLKESPYEKENVLQIINDVHVFEQDNPFQYIYNVNPSLWKREYLLKIVESFPNATYRDIESYQIQQFCKDFKFAILKSYSPLECGYYKCNSFFKFLHVTHNRVFLRLNERCVNSQGQSYIDMKDDYKSMVDDYNLRESYMWDPLSNG